ncbi:AAA family ATPase [Hydrogenophaga sp. 5NK40-0174]|uniref:AAA family ATPase n=1 Tax=Hydrogenophaga sp. 5NK40-0174 TaxID=3127649 RepID=UPI0031060C22
MGLKIFVVQGGVRKTTGKTTEYDTFRDFVEEWGDPTPLRDASKTSKERLPYFVGGDVRGKRHDDNVQSRTLLTLDIEAKATKQPPQPQKVSTSLRAEGLEGWVYTTASHTKDAPRYRVVLPLEKSIDPNELQAATVEAATALGLREWCQPESWVASQAMFLPATVAGTKPYSKHVAGKPFAPSAKAPSKATKDAPADILDVPEDPVLRALQSAGLYLHEDAKQEGKHYIRCPFADEHGTVNDTQTVYYEAHFDGHAKPAAKCLDTVPDEDGVPHLTYKKLVNWLREEGHLSATDENADTEAELEDPDTFWDGTAIGEMLDKEPTPLEFVIRGFAPAGRVTVLAGPGGVSKSSLALRLLLAAATGSEFGPFVADDAMRCMYLSYEDDSQTFHNRISAMYKAMDESVEGMLYDMDLVRKNLHIAAIADQAARWTLMRKDGRFGAPEATERLRWLRDLLKDNKVRLLVIDPVAYAHHLEESNPGEIAVFMQMLGQLAAETHCAILLLHHMHKTALWASLDEINQGSLRGASSFADNARSVGVLVSMPQKDATAYGLPATHDTVSRYAVFKHVKHNYSASLGVHVFERRGVLLEPSDVAQLDAVELAEAKAQQRTEDRERKRDIAAQKLLEFLHSRPDHTANSTAVSNNVFGKHGDRDGVTDWCQEQGYITVEDQGNGRAKPYRLTEKGAEYVAA